MNTQQCNKCGKACDNFDKLLYSPNSNDIGECRYVRKNFNIYTAPHKYNFVLKLYGIPGETGHSELSYIIDILLNWDCITLEDYLNILKMKEQLNAS